MTDNINCVKLGGLSIQKLWKPRKEDLKMQMLSTLMVKNKHETKHVTIDKIRALK